MTAQLRPPARIDHDVQSMPVPSADAPIIPTATDWHSRVRMLGPRDASWSLPLVDVVLATACLLLTLSTTSLLEGFGVQLAEIGPVEIGVPRDHDGSFESVTVSRRSSRLDGVDKIVLSLTARGLTTGGDRGGPRRGLRRRRSATVRSATPCFSGRDGREGERGTRRPHQLCCLLACGTPGSHGLWDGVVGVMR